MAIRRLIDKLRDMRELDPREYALLLENSDPTLRDYAAEAAREVAQAHFGRGVYIRGLIEISSYCRNDCYYCGLRRSNTEARRYRLSAEQILACCREGYALGFRTFVLQGGEDAAWGDDAVEQLVRTIRQAYPDCAVTLSLGEWSEEAYCRFFEAGANRYLLRHETASSAHYARLHPPAMSFDRRMECLRTLRRTGYQTGVGMMVGSPGQGIPELVEDLLFIQSFRPQMVGIGPYLPQRDTPFAAEPPGSADTTLLLLSLVRLMLPDALIPSTTALASLSAEGRTQGILAGANVVMPNLSPADVRGKYAIYDHKRAAGAEAAEGLQALARELNTIGYHIDYGRGDYAATGSNL